MSSRVRIFVILMACVTAKTGLSGCASTAVESDALSALDDAGADANPPAPHPVGSTLADIHALFAGAGAPRLAEACGIESEYESLKAQTSSKEERQLGMRELVRRNPDAAHWCFYARFLRLEEELRQARFIDEKQKIVIGAFSFLAPLAKALQHARQDTRYVAWAAERYRTLNEIVFYRKLEVLPAADVRAPASDSASSTVLRKYGLEQATSAQVAPPTVPVLETAPAIEDEGPRVPASAESEDPFTRELDLLDLE